MALPGNISDRKIENKTDQLINPTEVKDEPSTLNTHGVVLTGEEEGVARDKSPEFLFKLIKQSPEVIANAQAIVQDVLSYGVEFEWVGRKDTTGERKIEEARQFYWDNEEEIEAALFDKSFMGDMYLYNRILTRPEVKEKVDELISERYDFNTVAVEHISKRVATKEVMNDDVFSSKGLQQVPASTIQHELNEYGDIINFIQKLDGEENYKTVMPPEKIIHSRYMRLNGDTYGFAPVKSILTELSSLASMKNHNAIKFSNASVANKMFVLPDASPDSEQYQILKATIKKFRKLRNKHRDMALTGKVKVHELSNDDEMEFRELADYITRLISMTWSVPPSRLGVSVSGDTATRQAALSQEGYFKKINREQRRLENKLNKNVFVPEFNVRITFKNPDIKSEIRKTERDRAKTEVALKRMQMGIWDEEAAANYLSVKKYQIPKGEKRREIMNRMKAVTSTQNTMRSTQDIENDVADDQKNSDKRSTQENIRDGN